MGLLSESYHGNKAPFPFQGYDVHQMMDFFLFFLNNFNFDYPPIFYLRAE